MLEKFRADLHIHTCLSPCADLEMTPSAIVKQAVRNGLDIIAITDHNSAENVDVSIKTAENERLTVLAGMEITTSEEAHIIALFNDIESVLKLQDIVYKNLFPDENDAIHFGDQIVVNEENEIVSFNNRLLIASAGLTAYEVINIINSLGGLSIASHIDRGTFSIISQLGFIPEDLNFDSLEISPGLNKKTAERKFRGYSFFTFVTSSDAHTLDDIGKRRITLIIKEPTVQEIALALKNIDGRKVEWE